MASLQTYTVSKTEQAQEVTNLKKFVTLEVESMSDEDWVVVSQLTTVNLARCIDIRDAVEFAVTVSDNNKITIDAAEGASNDHVLILAVGV